VDSPNPAVAGTFDLTINFSGTDFPPTIVQQPQDQEAVERRDSPTFNVVANSATPITYQWQFNGVNIQGATNASLTLPNVRSDQDGTYRVTVSNQGGSVASQPVKLTVHTRPANDDFANRITLLGGDTTAQANNRYGTREDG